jgi:hypothetical protein
MTPMGEMPTPRLHAGMTPATFMAPGLVATAAFMMTAPGDDGMNRIDDTARTCRALGRALGSSARAIAAVGGATHATHAATLMAAHAAMTAAAGKCTVGGNNGDAQGAGERQHPQLSAKGP